jgi:signal transduction histidine kinase
VAYAILVQRIARWSRVASVLVIAMGALVFLGWALDHPVLNRLVSGRFIMQLNTGAAFLFAGLSLWVAPRWRTAAIACGAFVVLAGAAVLGEDAWQGVVLKSGRMEPETAANFVLMGLALMLRERRSSERALRLAQGFVVVAMFGAITALFSHAYSTKFSFGITAYTQMTLGTVIAFLVLGLGILFADPDRGLMATVSRDTPGGLMARRLYPAVVGIPIVLGGLILLGEEAHLYNGKLGLSIFVLSSIVVFAVLISLTYRSIDRTDAQRMRLAAVLLEEAERRHIARELHDEIGQSLTALKFHLERIGRDAHDREATSVAETRALVDELMARVSNLSLDLRPAMLDDLGLLPALVWLFERYTAQTRIRVEFQRSGLEGRFAPEVETAAFRVVQEALTNVARHASVDRVTVRAWSNDGSLGVQVVDAGKGFRPEETLARADSSGLIGMRERAAALGGQLTIEASPGGGVRLTAELPLSLSAQAKP